MDVDHFTLNRWILKFTPFMEKELKKKGRGLLGVMSWRMDETYVSIKGKWKYLYRAVDKAGLTVDFILTARRDRDAALRFLNKAMSIHKKPSKLISTRAEPTKQGSKAIIRKTVNALRSDSVNISIILMNRTIDL